MRQEELRLRARQCRLVLTDVDGVLTDAGVYYGPSGEVMKRFSIRDGMGVELLRNTGIETGIVTGERSEAVAARAAKLAIEELHLGAKNKRQVVADLLTRRAIPPEAVAYIGDDVNDLEVLTWIGEIGLTACPKDAVAEVQQMVHFTAEAAGGYGAFRAFAEWILTLRRGDR